MQPGVLQGGNRAVKNAEENDVYLRNIVGCGGYKQRLERVTIEYRCSVLSRDSL